MESRTTKEIIYDTWIDIDKIGYYEGDLPTFYNHVKQLIDYQALSKMIGQPLFVSGPHQEKLVLDDYRTFGHYNKAAIIWMRDNLIPGAEDQEFREFTQEIYDKYLSGLARTYYAALIVLNDDHEFKEQALLDYKQHMEKGIYFPAESKYYSYIVIFHEHSPTPFS